MHTVMKELLGNIPASRKGCEWRCLEAVLLLYSQPLDNALIGNFRQNISPGVS